MIYPRTVERFLFDLAMHAMQKRVQLRLVATRYVRHPLSGVLMNGCYVESPRQLVVATGKPYTEWLPVVVHESAHMDQHSERSPLFFDLVVPPWNKNASELLLDAVRHPDWYTEEDVQDFLCRVVLAELDAEKRAAQKIDMNNLPLDQSEYIRRANAYLWAHAMLLETKAWYPEGSEPYRTEAVWSLCPDHFDNEYFTVPDAFRSAYLRYCV